MKLFLISATLALLLCGFPNAAPQFLAGNGKNIEIVSNKLENIGVGGYSFGYQLTDGTTRTEEATVVNAGTENEYLQIRGSISWVGPDGVTYKIDFVADENGFQPKGEHLPK